MGMIIDDTPGFDVVGDVHGMGRALVDLLRHLGYDDSSGYFAHPIRTAVFVGDLVDRGPEQVLAVNTVRAMVEAGSAQMVLGNHELNAIHYVTRHRTEDRFLRPHTDHNDRQHRVYVDSVGFGSDEHCDMIEWFRSLPMWLELELDGQKLRIVHAFWDPASMQTLGDDAYLNDEVIHLSARSGSPEYEAIEVLLKGPELRIEPPYFDKDGNRRPKARFKWWKPGASTVMDAIVMQPNVTAEDGSEWSLDDPDAPVLPPVEPYPDDAPPVLFGHYWRTGSPGTPESSNIACTDFSACKGGLLAAYRWSGEQTLVADNFSWLPRTDSVQAGRVSS